MQNICWLNEEYMSHREPLRLLYGAYIIFLRGLSRNILHLFKLQNFP